MKGVKTMESTTTNTTPTTPETPATTLNPFSQLLKDFASAYDTKTSKNDPVYVELLDRLSMVCALSVLKKCINAHTSEHTKDPANMHERVGLPSNTNAATLAKLRNDLRQADSLLKCTLYASNNATETRYKEKSGNAYIVTVDKTLADGLKKLTASNLGAGIDLKTEAVISILEQLKKQTEREPNAGADLERPFTLHELKRKVWIKSEDSRGGWTDRETTPIQEVYRAIRRYIISMRGETGDPRAQYTYLEDYAVGENDEQTETTIYRRLNRYADMGGYVTSFSGGNDYSAYTVDRETVDETESIIKRLNLTAREAEILALRQRGAGAKAIATYLKISESTVKTLKRRVVVKAEKIGLTSEKYTAFEKRAAPSEKATPRKTAENLISSALKTANLCTPRKTYIDDILKDYKFKPTTEK